MELKVQVKLQSKKEGVEEIGENFFVVRVNEKPIEGKANKRVIELLSEHLDVPKSSIELYKGQKSKIKVFRII